MISPPGGDPGQLFRSLLQLPRPVAPIGYRSPLAPDFQLYAKALAHWEMPDDKSALIALSLCDENGDALLTAEDAGQLYINEAQALGNSLWAGLAMVSPQYTNRFDLDKWWRVLVEGARQNPLIGGALGSCFDMRAGKYIECPEQYFGVPRRSLLDCHWMAYRAAAQVFLE